ncbi:hypothetical protein IE53DRAFT_64377 [Violaceomyces palustris]|uniref:Uncharacterized protein n=1 Tax=Violaceomyces palustris TaxID=1673888 RepID=A0ACD0NZ43_9BASI|nr:hypothetical protein IE53DRAFT_64377 [Violaceomyces palustris]
MLRTYASRAVSRKGFGAAALAPLSARSPALSAVRPCIFRSLKTSATNPQATAAPQQPNAPSPNDSFINTTNAYYAEEMHRRWKEDPASVHSSWDVYFSGLAKGIPSELAYTPPPSLMALPMEAPPVDFSSVSAGQSVDDHLKVCALPPRPYSNQRFRLVGSERSIGPD